MAFLSVEENKEENDYTEIICKARKSKYFVLALKIVCQPLGAEQARKSQMTLNHFFKKGI